VLPVLQDFFFLPSLYDVLFVARPFAQHWLHLSIAQPDAPDATAAVSAAAPPGFVKTTSSIFSQHFCSFMHSSSTPSDAAVFSRNMSSSQDGLQAKYLP
jgi:hypothetical protein